MCGICGIIRWNADAQSEPISERVAAMVTALGHRGPDDSGLAESSMAVLGATRLAIRGVDDGKQPFVDPDTGVTVVCNGEIDNFRELRTWLESRGRIVRHATDVAVIPELYLELGKGFAGRLHGVFAVAVWDPRCKRLFLARDRGGERYLYYAVRDGAVSFASELSALVMDTSLDLQFSISGIAGYLQSGCFIGKSSPLEGVRKVAPAELVCIEPDQVTRHQYWRWNMSQTPKRRRTEPEFDEVFRAAVRRQTDIDVDYGVFLSGGLDSSLVAAVCKSVRPEKPLTGYTIRFGEASYDEGTYAEQVADTLGLNFVTVVVKPEMVQSELTNLIRTVGEPVADQSWVATSILARRVAKDVKYALIGEGADELFAGYPTYIGAQLAGFYQRFPVRMRAWIKEAVEAMPPSEKKVSFSFLAKRFVLGQELDGVARHFLWNSNFPPELMKRLGLDYVEPQCGERADRELLDLVQEADFQSSMAESLLAEKDRGSMHSALELRSPFLDVEVMQFAATLPVNQRVRGVTTKVFLKQFAQNYLPKKIVHRRKRGLSVPFSTWLRDPLHEWASCRLTSQLLDEAGVSSREAAKLLDEHTKKTADHGRALWTLVVLSEWLEWTVDHRKLRPATQAPAFAEASGAPE